MLTQTDPTELTDHNYYKQLDLKISITLSRLKLACQPVSPSHGLYVQIENTSSFPSTIQQLMVNHLGYHVYKM